MDARLRYIAQMKDYRRAFLALCIEKQILRFGEFTLKSGRLSPYFFNAGGFDSGAVVAALGDFYRLAIEDAGLDFDMLFGPAYKGIPLATAIATSFAAHGRDVPFAFDRKEAKTHGEGGITVGAPLAGRVLIVDDVVSAGTSVRHSIDLITTAGATPVGVALALDRQERGTGGESATAELTRRHGLQVTAIATLKDLLGYLSTDAALRHWAPAVKDYQEQYGVTED